MCALVLSALCFATTAYAVDNPEKRFGMTWETVIITPAINRLLESRGLEWRELRTYLNLPAPVFEVMQISAVECGSDADRKGVRVGDVVIAINGQTIHGPVSKIITLDELKDESQISSLIVERYGYTYQFFHDLQVGLGNGDFSCGFAD